MKVFRIQKLSRKGMKVPEGAKYATIINGKIGDYIVFTDLPVFDDRIEQYLSQMAEQNMTDIEPRKTRKFPPELPGKKFPSDGAKAEVGTPLGYQHPPRKTQSPFREDVEDIADSMPERPEDIVNGYDE